MNLRDQLSGELHDNPSVAEWVDNWTRLGLVGVDYGERFSDDERYEWVEGHPLIRRLREEEGEKITYDKGLLRATDFGKRFARAVDVRSSETAI